MRKFFECLTDPTKFIFLFNFYFYETIFWRGINSGIKMALLVFVFFFPYNGFCHSIITKLIWNLIDIRNQTDGILVINTLYYHYIINTILFVINTSASFDFLTIILHCRDIISKYACKTVWKNLLLIIIELILISIETYTC